MPPGALGTRGEGRSTAGRGEAYGREIKVWNDLVLRHWYRPHPWASGYPPPTPLHSLHPIRSIKMLSSQNCPSLEAGPACFLGERAPSLGHKSCQAHCPNPASGLGGLGGGRFGIKTHLLCIRRRDMTEEETEAEGKSASRRRDGAYSSCCNF